MKFYAFLFCFYFSTIIYGMNLDERPAEGSQDYNNAASNVSLYPVEFDSVLNSICGENSSTNKNDQITMAIFVLDGYITQMKVDVDNQQKMENLIKPAYRCDDHIISL